METFFLEALRSFKTSGTIKPSSKYLINGCLKGLDFSGEKIIVEFGAGDGCITNELTSMMNQSSELYSFEVNQKFYSHCVNVFSMNKNIFIINESAFEFQSILDTYNIDKVDYFISSLPLSLFSSNNINLLLNQVYHRLKNDGLFIQYQYSLGKYFEFRNIFDKVGVGFTIRNIPPAFIFRCSKTSVMLK
jgi:phospholipid N-methyltransferase